MIKVGLIKCSPNTESLSGLGLNHAIDIIKQDDSLTHVFFEWSDIFEYPTKICESRLEEIHTNLLSCDGFLWAMPVHHGKTSTHASIFLETFAESMKSKIHAFILAAGSPYFYLSYKDISFQIMISTDSIVLPKAAFICAKELENNQLALKTKIKIKDFILDMKHLSKALNDRKVQSFS